MAADGISWVANHHQPDGQMVSFRLAIGLGNSRRRAGAQLVRPTLDESSCTGNDLILTVFILSVVGYFIHRHRKGTCVTTHQTLQGELPELIDQLIVLLRAGYTPANAFLQLELWLMSPLRNVVAEVNALVGRGVRFSSAVVELRQHIGPPAYALVDAVIQLDSDGFTTPTILDRLSDEAHAQRRLGAEAKARELPVRLILPMVCCVLPSFIMLTVVPMLAVTLVALRTHLG